MIINRNVDELMIITRKITNFNVISFSITTMFDKCDLYSIRDQKLHDFSQIKIFNIFTTFALDRSWHYSTMQGFTPMEIFSAQQSLDNFPQDNFCYYLKIPSISILPLCIRPL